MAGLSSLSKQLKDPSSSRAGPSQLRQPMSDNLDSSDDEADRAESSQDNQPQTEMAMSSSLHALSETTAQMTDQVEDLSAEDQRRQLSLKLQAVFSLPASEQVQSCHSCWLYRSVLLQGHLYLTDSHALFYAYLPSKADRVLKAGPLRKRTQKTFRFSQHWAVLRGQALSWYDSVRDPYFPQDHINLHNVLDVRPEARNPRHFQVQTPYRLFVFGVENEESRDDWVRVLRKATFRTQNEGDSVKISIPLEAIVDVETAAGPDRTDMINLQVVDAKTQDFALDEYYFLHFRRQAEFLDSLKASVRAHASQETSTSGSPRSTRRPDLAQVAVRDSTGSVRQASNVASLREAPHIAGVNPRKDSLRRQRQQDEAAAAAAQSQSEPPPAVAVPISSRQAMDTASIDESHSSTPRASSSLESTYRPDSSFIYPPRPSEGRPPLGYRQGSDDGRGSWPLPGWLKDVPARMLTTSNARQTITNLIKTSRGPASLRPVSEVWSKTPRENVDVVEATLDTDESLAADLSESQISQSTDFDSPLMDDVQDQSSDRQIRDFFTLNADEVVLSQQQVALYRVLPVSGMLYITSQHLCFRSAGLARTKVGRTRMVLPLSQVVSCTSHTSFRLGYSGLVITIRGHEELFLEFPASHGRDDCQALIDNQIEKIRQGQATTADPLQRERTDAVVLTDLSEKAAGLSLSESTSSVDSSGSSSRLQAMSLTSLRPKNSLSFTILTIGSRGDVQPYVALAKGLVAESHKVKIATHAEFGPWIQRHGIGFVEIGGDPAELMRICVENGTFTLSFLREGVTKFRGWLDDLLLSCWLACQGTDVIIESPNAMAGIHIAEALQIPYYRSFTMPWSRTRAYPQAFAVPSKKAGGNYNYMTYVIFDQVLWTASSSQINRWRRDCLGLLPTTLDRLQQHKTPFLYNFSPSLVPKPLDWYDWIHVTGFWFLDNPDQSKDSEWSPPADLVAFIEETKRRGKKVVYIGWGSITVPDAAATTRCVVEAVVQSGVHAILSKGWSDRLSKTTTATQLPDSIFPIDSVPHDWLFPLIDAACHHGGAGTLGASLRAGLPTIVKPFFGDQFFWGQQIESLGVGSCVRELTVTNLAAALRMATQNERQIERAQQLGRQIRAEKGVETAIRAIYADLEYATSLIRARAQVITSPSDRRLPSDPRGRQGLASTATSSPSDPSSPAGLRSFSPATGSQRSMGNTESLGARLSAHVRSESGNTTSDEWSVVSGSEGGSKGSESRSSDL